MSAEDRVAKIVCDQLGVDRKALHADTRFSEDLGVDSLDEVEMIMELEEEFDIMIEDDQAEKIQTFGQLVKFIDEKLAA